jgi:multiple sugar transport system substrate-binding protein
LRGEEVKKLHLVKVLSLSLVMSLTLAACGGGGSQGTENGGTTSSTKSESTDTSDSNEESKESTEEGSEAPDDSSSIEEGLEAPHYVPEEPVTITYFGWENELNFNILAEKFNERHKNIEVVRYPNPIEGDDQLTKMAASGELPDVISVFNLGSAIRNGWLADVTPYFKADPIAEESSYMNIIDGITTYDKLYALPTTLYLNALMVNLDLLRHNNIEIPEYTWTYEDHEKILKDATVAGESRGNVDVRWSIDFYPATYANDPVGRYWFNQETHRFELGKSFEDIVNHFDDLLAAEVSIWEHADKRGKPWELEEGDPEREKQEQARHQYLLDAIGVDDDGWAVGKTATHAWEGSGFAWTIRDQRYPGFEYDHYPYPMNNDHPYDEPRYGVATDFAGVSSSAKDPEAAYEFLRYLSYETQGFLDRIDGINNYDREAYIEKYDFSDEYIETLPEDPAMLFGVQGPHVNAISPANTDVAREAWKEFHPIGSPDATPGHHYALDHLENAYLDNFRAYPGYADAANYIIENIWSQVIEGDMAPGDIAQELEDGANQILEDWENDIKAAVDAQ